MKWLLCVLIVLLLLANAALLVKQLRIEERIEVVRAENAQLVQELASRPTISPEQYEQAQQHAERAEAVMRATEQRLTNAAAILSSLEAAAARTQTAPARYDGLRTPRRSVNPVSDFEGFVPNDITGLVPGTLIPSSSHTPYGRVQQRNWGPEQLLGPPNTHQAGDIPTAWAPRSSQGAGEEWLHVNYDRAVDISEVNVHETYNPGAISKVAAVLPDGRETVIWEGTTPPGQAPLQTTFRVPPGIQAQSVKVYLDRTRVPGWNEIDAIELVSRDGTRQWASSASASSSYAER